MSCVSTWEGSLPLPPSPPPPLHRLPFLRLCSFPPLQVLRTGHRLGRACPLSLPPHHSPPPPLSSSELVFFPHNFEPSDSAISLGGLATLTSTSPLYFHRPPSPTKRILRPFHTEHRFGWACSSLPPGPLTPFCPCSHGRLFWPAFAVTHHL